MTSSIRFHLPTAAILGCCLALGAGGAFAADDDITELRKDSAESRHEVQLEQAEANREAAKEACNALEGDEEDLCNTQADAEYDKAVAQAEADREAAAADAESGQATRDADYEVAEQRCEELEGNAQDACIAEARMKYGQN
jgi:hypothetical protein